MSPLDAATPTGGRGAIAAREVPRGSGSALLAFRLAWRQLRHEPARLAAALSGVMFACVLIFMQLGFLNALMDSAVTLQLGMRAEIYIMPRTTEALWRSSPFPRARLMQALAAPEVARVTPLSVSPATMKNPQDGQKRTLLLLGVDPEAGLFALPGLTQAKLDAVTRPDTILFDARAKPQFGPIPQLLANGPVVVELNNRRTEIVGLFAVGPTFGTEGHAITSDVNFRRFVPGRSFGEVDVGAVFLRPGADPETARARLAALLPDDVMVLTHAGLVQFERDYWTQTAPIGFVFGLGVVIGLVVGCVIVYQILFSDISRHISEYATLKAIGYPNAYLARVVLGEALILAVVGFVPGVLLAHALYALASARIYIPLVMDLRMVSFVLGLIFVMCVLSGLLALRKLRDANPADMF